MPLLCAAAVAVLLAALDAGTGRFASGSTPSRFLPGLVTTGYDDAHVSFSPDGRTLYFLRSSPDFAHWTVLVTRWVDGRWSPAEVAPFSGRWNDGDVTVSRDGRRLFFISNRPTDGGTTPRPDTELWVAERVEDGWGAPRHLSELESPGDEWFPTVTDDGTLYFGSERPGGHGKSDLWRARWLGDHFGPPENLGDVVNSPEQEIEPWISPDERMLVFAAKNRPGGKGEYDLFVTFRCAGRWTPPRPLGAGVNSPAWDFGPRFSPDGTTFYFTSNRSDLDVPPERPLDAAAWMARISGPGNGLRDVYRVDAAALDLCSPCR
jgi:Tol biopolymer transport system component